MTYLEIIKKVSQEINVPLEIVDEAYKSYWKFIKQTIQSLPLKSNISEEEFSKLRTTFNLPSLGKLVCNFNRLKGVKKRYQYIKNLKNAKS